MSFPMDQEDIMENSESEWSWEVSTQMGCLDRGSGTLQWYTIGGQELKVMSSHPRVALHTCNNGMMSMDPACASWRIHQGVYENSWPGKQTHQLIITALVPFLSLCQFWRSQRHWVEGEAERRVKLEMTFLLIDDHH